MAKHYDLPLYRLRPLPEAALPQSEAAPVVLDSLASLDADRRVPEVPRWMRLLIAAAALIGALAGCGGGEPASEPCVLVSRGFWRCHDSAAGVTCWSTGDYRGGYSCLPDSALPAEA